MGVDSLVVLVLYAVGAAGCSPSPPGSTGPYSRTWRPQVVQVPLAAVMADIALGQPA